MSRRTNLAVALLVPLLVACSGTITPSPSATAGAPTAAASVPTAPPSAAAPTAAPCPAPGVIPPDDLPLCSYSAPVAGLTATFTIASPGWQGEIYADGFDLVIQGPTGGGFNITHFVGAIFSDPCSPDAKKNVAASAKAFIDALAANKQLKVGAPVTTTLAGAPAIQVDVTADALPACAGPRIWLWVLPTVGDFHLNNGEAARFIAADIGGQTIIAVSETFSAANQGGFVAKVQPILDSMTIK
jgi:hypothetical protein